ncbi:MAG: leucine-rich repeat domain-containing protein, partial [Fretibacterium sp.]|nr:leucine-rich repeat domain-containing protein [Fretibacterium sp.]
MRKRVFVCLLAVLAAFAGPGWAAVTINATNFPDANFRAYVLDELDTDGNGSLSDAEITEAKTIDVSGRAITTLKGISFFSGLRRLYCNDNGLETLDVSACEELRILHCNNNVLKDLDVSGCTKLTTLHCYNNLLTELGVGDCTNLHILSCHNNLIESLDVSKCMALTSLRCYSNKITALDVTKCGNLETLYCYSNLLTTLDLSKCPKLTVTGYNIEFGQVIPNMADAGPSGNAEYPYQIDLNTYTTISHVISSSVKGYSGENVIETQYNEGTGIVLFKTQPTGVQYNYDTGFTGVEPASASPIYMDVTLTKGIVINVSELPDGYVGTSYNFYLTVVGTLTKAPTWNAVPLP